MRPSSVLAAMVLAAACKEKPPAVLTEVSIELPPDEAASAEWGSFRLRVWPAGEACPKFVAWAGADCDGQNPAPPDLWDDLAVEVTRGSAPEITLDRSDGWDVAVEGLRIETDEPFLFGCARVSSGEPAVVRLRRRVGDADVCAGVHHRACPVYVRCEIPDGGNPEDPGSPTCLAAADEATSFEEDGVDCTPDGGPLPYPCKPARVSCERDASNPLEDGVCPSDEEEPACSTSIDDDLNCDGTMGPPCEADPGCTPGTETPCGAVGGGGCFAGSSTCTEAGTWSGCARNPEVCNGLDDDCDGLPDDVDEDAAGFCTRSENLLADHCGATRDGGTACLCVDDPECGPPLSDQCSPDGCLCGDGPPCGQDDPPVTDTCGSGGCTCGEEPPCGQDGSTDRCEAGHCLCVDDEACGPPLSDHCGPKGCLCVDDEACGPPLSDHCGPEGCLCVEEEACGPPLSDHCDTDGCLCGEGPKCGQEKPLPLTNDCGAEGCRCGDDAPCGQEKPLPLTDNCGREGCLCGDDDPCGQGDPRLSDRCGPEGCLCGDEPPCGRGDPPLSDRCVRQACACGDREPCGRGQQCCEGRCIDGDEVCSGLPWR